MNCRILTALFFLPQSPVFSWQVEAKKVVKAAPKPAAKPAAKPAPKVRRLLRFSATNVRPASHRRPPTSSPPALTLTLTTPAASQAAPKPAAKKVEKKCEKKAAPKK